MFLVFFLTAFLTNIVLWSKDFKQYPVLTTIIILLSSTTVGAIVDFIYEIVKVQN